MKLVDESSDVLTDGAYLEMCNCLKAIHDHLTPVSDSDIDDEFFPEGTPPEILICIQLLNEISMTEMDIAACTYDLSVVEKSIKKLKPILRVTDKVKRAAIEDFCESDRRLVGGGDNEWTFSNLLEHSPHRLPPRYLCYKNCFDSVERSIYEDYKTYVNEKVNRLLGQAQTQKLDLEVRIAQQKAKNTDLITRVSDYPRSLLEQAIPHSTLHVDRTFW